VELQIERERQRERENEKEYFYGMSNKVVAMRTNAVCWRHCP